MTKLQKYVTEFHSRQKLKWDLGLPYDYHASLIPYHPELFSLVNLPDDRVGLKLLSWDDELAVSELEKNATLQQNEEDMKNGCLAFPIGFTRGFGLKRKCMEWLKEWQRLPYTSPYTDASHLDPRTDMERFASMLRKGLLDRSRGLYKTSEDSDLEHERLSDVYDDEMSDNQCISEEESYCDLLSKYDSDEPIHDPR
ncbi:protein root primordium defective 1 [Quercus suber]|uniref:Protein root primordium defective 1 n=1 Tax=Quercus suber TaxID=58331 RepID=A0AAW0L9J3_QUESU